MAINDFLPVAIEGTPNVLDQADYAASVSREQGWATGAVPTAVEWNKMLRQSSCIAALLASFIVSVSGADMLDNGDQAAKLSLLLGTVFRIKLYQATTFYVATTGNDVTGDGTVGSPWLTPQHAITMLATCYDIGNQAVTIQLADGAYNNSGTMLAFPFVGGNNVTIKGNVATPANVHFTGNSSFSATNAATIALSHFKIDTSGDALNATGYGLISGDNIVFGNTGNDVSLFTGGLCTLTDCTLTGARTNHVIAGMNSIFTEANTTLTLTGTPTFTTFADVYNGGAAYFSGCVITGPGTGQRYAATSNGLIDTNGGGAAFLPGSIAGATATGGQYV